METLIIVLQVVGFLLMMVGWYLIGRLDERRKLYRRFVMALKEQQSKLPPLEVLNACEKDDALCKLLHFSSDTVDRLSRAVFNR